jgi:hypothetical protein
MITAQQIREKLQGEKDPLGYIDGEIARCAGKMSDDCENVQDTLAAYTGRTNKDEQIDIQKLKDELMSVGLMYGELIAYTKVRKQEATRLKRAEQVNKAMVRRQKQTDKR